MLDFLEADDQRFSDDKLDILQFETYDQAPMDPTQSFDVGSAFGRNGAPDPAMIQFARLLQIGWDGRFFVGSHLSQRSVGIHGDARE